MVLLNEPLSPGRDPKRAISLVRLCRFTLSFPLIIMAECTNDCDSPLLFLNVEFKQPSQSENTFRPAFTIALLMRTDW